MAVKFPDPTGRLEEIYSRVEEIVAAFSTAGRHLYLVGGSVRDAIEDLLGPVAVVRVVVEH